MNSGGFLGRVRRWIKGQMFKQMHRMITCREFESFIVDYLDDELSQSQRSVFERHLRLCRECREYLDAYQRANEIGRTVLKSSDEAVPEDVPDDLIKAILDARDK